MSNYTKSTNFATKDNLPTGDPLKIVKGTEIDTEFNNISTAIATKTDNASAAITGGTITGITDLAIADGGTGASTATAAINNLLPSQTSNANKYLQTDGTNVSWDAVSLSTSDITGTLPVANGGTGVTSSTGTGSVVLSNSPTLVTPALGTPASGTVTNLTGTASININGTVGATTPNTGAFTTLSASSTVSGSGFSSYLASPPSIGGTTANSGSFTTINASSSVTLSGGTANGVAYLNGSKVLTTGSALTFNGNNLTSDRSTSTAYSGTTQSTWANGIVLNNNSTPATGLFNSIYFSNSANMINVFGVAQNASGYGDFVWSGYSGSYAEWMKLTSSGLSVTGTLSASSTATLNTLSSSGATLTGGTINGMTIGATTASTGAFTTLTTSSTVTISGGTANGVTYLNGSKVLTSGSALTFDGTNLGIGTTPTYSIEISQAAPRIRQTATTGTNTSLVQLINTGGTASIGLDNSSGVFGAAYGLTMWHSGNYPLVFGLNSTEQMRLTSTGLGIGTSSPSVKLQVEGAANSAALTLLRLNNSGTTSGGPGIASRISSTAGATSLGYIQGSNFASGVGGLQFSGDGTNAQATLDNSGNLGLGVTPSAWGQGTAFEIYQKGYGLWNGSGNPSSIYMLANSYFNGGFKYASTGGYASSYYQYNGQHVWSTAPSGTAGNAITFTQAMTLDASGNLSVGTTSSGGKITAAVANNASFQTAASFTNATNADFNVRIKTSVTDIGCSTATPLTFSTANTEAARIDSSGNLLVGTTSSSGTGAGTVITSGGAVLFTRNNTNYVQYVSNLTTSGSAGFITFEYGTAQTQIGSISTAAGSVTLYNTTSDYRLKEVIGAVTGHGERIDALEPIEYEWKSNGSRTRGFLAHKFKEVYADSVSGEKDAVDEDGNPVYQQMQAGTAEVIADLVAEIQSLRKRLADAGIA